MRFRTAVCADCGNEIKRKKDSARFKEIGNSGVVVRCLICADKRRMKRWKKV